MHPRKNPDAPFLVLGGFIDFLVPSTYANAHGAITGLANVAPVSLIYACLNTSCSSIQFCIIQYTIAKLFELSVQTLKDPSLLNEAQRLQGIVARADFTIAKASIAGTKSLLQKLYGYGGHPRRPLPPIESDVAAALWAHPDTQAIVKVERELSGKI